MQFPPTSNAYFITGNGIFNHFYIYLSPLGSFEVAQLFSVGFFLVVSNPSTLAALRARPIQHSLTSFPRAFACLTQECVCSDALGAHSCVNSPGRRVYLLCCVCKAPKISHQKLFLCWGEGEEEEGDPYRYCLSKH